MTGASELILFGIKAGIKLAQQGRQLYVEAAIDNELVLPMLNFDQDPTVGVADGYFNGAGRSDLNNNPVLRELYDISMHQTRPLTDAEKRRYLAFYLDCKCTADLAAGRVTGGDTGLTREALLSIVQVRQWANRQSPFPSPQQRIIGSLIEIGIDYFVDMPGAVNEKSASGRALKGFLKSIDDVDFAQEKVHILLQDLFLAAVETIGQNPDLLNADRKTEKMVQAIATGLIQDATDRIEALAGQDLDLRESVQAWSQLVLRSVLAHAGEVIFAGPDFYLEIDDPAHQALIGSVGQSLLNVILDSKEIDLTRVISREGLDTIVKAALKTLAEHPELLGTDNRGLEQILSQMAGALANSTTVLGPAIVPEVMAMVLDKSAGNLDYLWPEKFRNDPAKHLLITAATETLTLLAEAATGAGQAPLCKRQLSRLLDFVLDQVVENPAWLTAAAGTEGSILAAAIEAALSAAGNIDDGRINAKTLLNLMETTIKAVAMRRNLIDSIPLFGRRQVAVQGALELIFDTVLPATAAPEVRWTFERADILKEIVATVLYRFAETGVTEDILLRLRKVLQETSQTIAAGGRLSMAMLTAAVNELDVA